MDRGFPNERDIRLMEEAANIHEQLRSFDPWGDLYSVQRIQEERRRVERDLRAADAVRYLHEVEQLRHTLGASQLDLQRIAQEALDQHERIRDAIGYETLEAAMEIAEQRVEASLEAERLAEIVEQLDRHHFARTLEQAQELLANNAIADMLAQQADIQAIVREAWDAMDAYPMLEPGEITAGPPE